MRTITADQTEQKPPVKKKDEIKERWQKETTGNSSGAVRDPALDPLQENETGVSEPGAAIIHSGTNGEVPATGNGAQPPVVAKTERKEKTSATVTAAPIQNLTPVLKQKARQTKKKIVATESANDLANAIVDQSIVKLIEMVLRDNDAWTEDPAREPGDFYEEGKLYPAPDPNYAPQKIVEAITHFSWPAPEIEVVTEKVDPSIIGLPENTGVALRVHFRYLE